MPLPIIFDKGGKHIRIYDRTKYRTLDLIHILFC